MVSKFGIHIKVKNIRKSLRFYLAFGLKPKFAYGDEAFVRKLKGVPTAPEKYHGVIFNIGGGLFEIADGHTAVKQDVFQQTLQSSKVSSMLHVNSVEEVVKICRKNKFALVVEPKVFPWGTKEVVVKDPDGFILVFIERL